MERKIKVADIFNATKKILKEIQITRLSDLTRAMDTVYSDFDVKKYNLVNLFEHTHFKIDPSGSVLTFNTLIRNDLSLETVRHLHQQYTELIEEFIDSVALNSKFPMDESDKLGWKIYYELDKKIEALQYLISVETYKEKCND